MNIFTTRSKVYEQTLVVLTTFSMILSFTPIFSVKTAQAATAVNFSLFVVPNPVGTDSDLEYLTISNTSGQSVDLTGWKLVEGSDEINLTGALPSSSDILVCANTNFSQNGGKNCDYGFIGGFALVNSGGSVSLVAPGGETVVTVSWGDVSGSESNTAVSKSGSLDGVLGTTGGDKIDICHATESGNNPYTNPSVSINSFFSSGHDKDNEDIIPPFYYDNGNGVMYFPGTNWDTAGKELWSKGCVDGDEQKQVTTVKLCKIAGVGIGLKNFELFLKNGNEVYSGVTKKDGCVEIPNVPHGTYILDEVMPSNMRWVNIVNEIGEQAGAVKRGTEVVVSDNSSYFVLQNRECETGTFNYGNNECVEPPVVCEDPKALNYQKEGECEYPQPNPVCEIGENLLSNGSFEEPVINSNWVLTSIVNWIVTKVSDNTNVNGELWRGLFGGASHGEQNVELDSTVPTKLTQNVTTIPGATYELRFDFSPRKATGLADNNVDALIDGNVLINAQGDGSNLTGNTWTTYNNTFVASGASTEVSFRDNGTANGLGSLIDNAVMCLVKEPEPTQCEDETPGWADAVVTYDQGLKKNGQVIAANRSDENAVLGGADWSNGGISGFFSLGFGGSIIIAFDKYVPDVVGNDISIHEATNGTNYPEETALIEVSQNGSDWKTVGTASNMNNISTRVSYFDISSTGWSWIKFVRITDTTDSTLHNNDADGFDLDAIDATKELCNRPEEPKFGKIKVFKWVKNQNPEEVSYEDFSFQIDNNNPIHFNSWGFGWDKEPLGHTYEVKEVDIPEGYEHFMTICEVYNYDQYNHFYEGDQLEQLPQDMQIYKDDDNPNWTSSNEVTLENEGDVGICLIINKKKTGGGEPLECKPGVELIQNGGFEEPIVVNNAGWDIFDSGITWLVKWLSPDSNATDPGLLELHRGVNGWLPSEGSQYAELDGDYQGPGGSSGEPASTEISQTIDTIPGKTYTLRWDFSPRPKTVESENDLLVKINGGQIANNKSVGGNQTNWTSHSYSFVATSNKTNIAFADNGKPNSVGTFVDRVSLMCEPETPYGPYCGDGIKNQEWEQCDLGYTGNETGETEYGLCNSKCQYENQCSTEQLVRINLDDTESTSFDGKLYLGSASNPIPAGTWFKFDVAGDDSAATIANAVDGLAVERDQTNGLQLAFKGGNKRRSLDIVKGSIELMNLKNGTVTRYLVDALGFGGLENSAPAFIDIFDKVDMQNVVFDMRADTGDDSVTLGLDIDEDAIAQCTTDENKYTLSVTVTGDGSGIVESSDTNISCDSSGTSTHCVHVYNAGTIVDLTATPFAGSNFDSSWTAGHDTCIGNNQSCQVTMDEDIDLVAHFALNQISTNRGGGGAGRKSELGGGSGNSGNSDNDQGPIPQVAGEQVSVVPFGAPNAGGGGTSPVLPQTYPLIWLGIVAVEQRKHYVR